MCFFLFLALLIMLQMNRISGEHRKPDMVPVRNTIVIYHFESERDSEGQFGKSLILNAPPLY